jgi:5-methylcytosine-specific restriction endonuclease McrA
MLNPNFVFVVDAHKRTLTPCSPCIARKLLEAGKAAIFRRYPFVIILKKEVDAISEPITLKIDPGSRVTGFALLKGNSVIYGAELTHRGLAIRADLKSRRAIRRSRRNRHCRYRQARFLNRTRPKGWLAPSLAHRVRTTMTWVARFRRFAPIGSIVQELVRFDLQQHENPEISGIEYQQGELSGYEVREYLLNKWDRRCTYCKKEGVPLQVEHIQCKAKGGSNRIANLCLACEPCNLKKGTKDIEQFLIEKPDLLKQIKAQQKRPLKDAAAVNSTRWALFRRLENTGLPVSVGSGGLTKFNRTRLELPKTHWLDAACVGVVVSLKVLIDLPLRIKCNGHGSRQMCRTDKFGFPSRYVSRFKFVKGFQTGDIVKAKVLKGKNTGVHVGRVAVRSSGSFNISTLHGLVQGVNQRCMKPVHCKDGYSYGQ